MDQVPQPKWDWSVSAPFKEANVDQICPLLIDFLNIHKWFPGLPTCHGIHGNNGEVGCIRKGSGFSIPSVDGSMSWSKERLTAVDPAERMITYEIIDCNIGFMSYVSTVKICPGGGDGRCGMWWFVNVEPIGGWRMEEMVGNYEDMLRAMVRNMESYVLERFGNSCPFFIKKKTIKGN